jgi:hypothetical protein
VRKAFCSSLNGVLTGALASSSKAVFRNESSTYSRSHHRSLLDIPVSVQVAALPSKEEYEEVRNAALSAVMPLHSHLSLSANPMHRKIAAQSVLPGALSVLNTFSEPQACAVHSKKLLAVVWEMFQSSNTGALAVRVFILGCARDHSPEKSTQGAALSSYALQYCRFFCSTRSSAPGNPLPICTRGWHGCRHGPTQRSQRLLCMHTTRGTSMVTLARNS